MVILVTCLILVVSYANGVLISPCPDVFRYMTSPDLPDRWYGVIDVSEDLVQAYNWVYVELDRKAHILTGRKGTSSTSNFREFLIEKRDYFNALHIDEKLDAESYDIVTSYDYAQPIPRVKIIRVNGQEICRDNSTESKDIPSFPTLPPIPNKLLLAKLNAANYVPDYLEIKHNSTTDNTE